MPESGEERESGASRRGMPDDNVIEVNHRVANSLQLVATFLSLQQRGVADAAAKEVLKTASTRIAAIGRVQRALMRSSGSVVDLNAFLGVLCDDLQTLTGLSISTQIDDVAIDPARAQHLGVAVNELLINAAKHGYLDLGGEVMVTCERAADDFLEITVADRGQGLPDRFEPEIASSIGMTILRSAVGQLQGELTFQSTRGATAKLKFPARVSAYEA